jgi:hypothetical protein
VTWCFGSIRYFGGGPVAPAQRPLNSRPNLFEVEDIAVSISKVIKHHNVFPEFRYLFLLDQIRREFDYTVEIVPDDMLSAAAYVDNKRKRLFLRASIHTFGLKGETHPLMVLYHEFVHIFQNDQGIRHKAPGFDLRKLSDLTERWDELIANRVAGAIAVPFAEALALGCSDAADLIRFFHVTRDAAKQRMPQIKEMIIERRSLQKQAISSKILAALQDYESKTNSKWPAPGSADTELGVLMEPEVCHGATEVYTGVQA